MQSMVEMMKSPENMIRTQILSQPPGTFWFNDCTRRKSPHAYYFENTRGISITTETIFRQFI